MKKAARFAKENYHFISLAVLFFVVLGILLHGGYQNDDFFYMQGAICTLPRLFSFLNYHFLEVNGRNLVHFFVILFLRYNWELHVWRVLGAFTVSLVCYFLGALSSSEKDAQKRNTVICCILYLCVHPNLWRLSVYWLTGSFNYFFPFALLMILLFRYSKKQNTDVLCVFLSLVVGATTEQSGILPIGFFVLAIIHSIICSKKIKLKDVLCLIASTLGYSTIWLSPGTTARSTYLSLYENNDILKNAVHLLKMNWFENTGMIIFNGIIVLVLAYWLFRLETQNRALMLIQRAAAIGILILGAGNTLFTAVIYCFGYNVGIDDPINQAIFVLWLLMVALVLGAMAYISCVLYFQRKNPLFIISTILGIGDQLVLVLVYDNGYRTMIASLFAFMMLVMITANDVFDRIHLSNTKIISALLVLVLFFGAGHYMIGKDCTRTSKPTNVCPAELLDEDGKVKPLTDEELEIFFQWIREALKKSQVQPSDRKDIRDFSDIPAVNKYNLR